MPAADVSERSLTELISLRGRGAVVTGAGRGIGAAIARRLAEAGATVMVTDVDEASAKAVAAELSADGTLVVAASLDVTDAEAVDAVADRAQAELGSVDILCNNAGVFPLAPAFSMPEELWSQVLGVNRTGAFLCSKAIGSRMAAGGGGVIVNTCSTQSLKAGAPGLAAYTASKHGLLGLTSALAVELGQANIRVLGVAPTIVDTPGLQANMPIFEAAGVGDVIAQTAASLPLGRVAVPDDVARVVLFAVSDLAILMSGSLLLVDAGAMTL